MNTINERVKKQNEIKNLIKNNKTYQLILKDSFGGIMYDIENQNKYKTKKLLNLFEKIEDKSSMDGIMKGVFNFIIEKY